MCDACGMPPSCVRPSVCSRLPAKVHSCIIEGLRDVVAFETVQLPCVYHDVSSTVSIVSFSK